MTPVGGATVWVREDGPFDAALVGHPLVLVGQGGERLVCAPGRWFGAAAGEDDWLLRRCTGATLDLGCGPGRLVAALATRGTQVLGVDRSGVAVGQCRSRGGPAVQADLFASLPGEGTWEHVLLADGNIGIGGDPVAVLRRGMELLRPGGDLLVETSPGSVGGRGWSGLARFHHPADGDPVGDWFAWAEVTTPALVETAGQLGLGVLESHRGRREFVRLTVPPA